jgi:RimJ/RimL family protein N-acetyltransferase
MLAIEDPSGTLIGMVESNTDHEHFSGHESGDANVSYALYPFARGLGYASRAVTLMEQFLRERGTRRAVIRVEADHERSIALARRLDYDFVGEVAESNGTTYRLYRKTLL